MVFGVPTMYSRIAKEAETDQDLARSFAKARLLVSGSAALPMTVHEAMKRLTGQQILERYGLTETLMNTGTRLGDPVIPGRVGPPLPNIEVQLIAEDGATIEDSDDETIGEVAVRGPNVFTGYLNRPDATAEAMRDGWFMTGDMATRNEAGSIKLVGRKSTDLIKSGGYRIGAGEIEGALLEHPAVSEVGRDRTARRGPRRADRRLGRDRARPHRHRRGARIARGHPAHEAQAPARGPLHRGAAPQRDGQGHEARAPRALEGQSAAGGASSKPQRRTPRKNSDPESLSTRPIPVSGERLWRACSTSYRRGGNRPISGQDPILLPEGLADNTTKGAAWTDP